MTERCLAQRDTLGMKQVSRHFRSSIKVFVLPVTKGKGEERKKGLKKKMLTEPFFPQWLTKKKNQGMRTISWVRSLGQHDFQGLIHSWVWPQNQHKSGLKLGITAKHYFQAFSCSICIIWAESHWKIDLDLIQAFRNQCVSCTERLWKKFPL